MNTDITPKSYQEWYHCITVICQQELTLPYIEIRIKALNSPNDFMTQRFVKLYGERQKIKTLQWFEQAKNVLQ